MMLSDVPCTRHYFSVKHGKGPLDRTGANFKCKIRSAVRAGKILLSTDGIAEYCRENFDCQIGCGSDECDVNKHDVNECDVNECDINKKQNPHSLFKVYHHRTILWPGIKGVVEYHNFDCGCLSCTTHTNECLQNEYVDEWKKISLVPGKKMDLSFNTCDWFKAVEVEDRPNNDAFMQFEEEINDTVHCDEIENEDYTEHYVTEDNNNVTEEIFDTEEERDVTEEEHDEEIVEEGDHDVTEEEHDVTEEEHDEEIVEEGDRDVTEEERDVTEEEHDVTEEERDEEIVEEGDCDVTEEGNDSVDSLVELYTIAHFLRRVIRNVQSHDFYSVFKSFYGHDMSNIIFLGSRYE